MFLNLVLISGVFCSDPFSAVLIRLRIPFSRVDGCAMTCRILPIVESATFSRSMYSTRLSIERQSKPEKFFAWNRKNARHVWLWLEKELRFRTRREGSTTRQTCTLSVDNSARSSLNHYLPIPGIYAVGNHTSPIIVFYGSTITQPVYSAKYSQKSPIRYRVQRRVSKRGICWRLREPYPNIFCLWVCKFF